MPLNRWVNISWTDHTYNYWKGCAKTSEGCRFCWAEDVMTRFDHTPEDWTIEHIQENLEIYDETPGDCLDVDPAWIFTPSASDPYLPWLPEEARKAWLDGIEANPQHCYQVLTKWGPEGDVTLDLPENVILGVSVETPRRRYRIDWLREQEATVKFISFEPLIERIMTVDLTGIDWIIVGGESQRDADLRREMHPIWPIFLLYAARRSDTAFLFKQHSGAYAEKDRRLALFDGTLKEFNEFPAVPEGLPLCPHEYL